MCGGFGCKKRGELHFGIQVVVGHMGPVVALVALQVDLEGDNPNPTPLNARTRMPAGSASI